MHGGFSITVRLQIISFSTAGSIPTPCGLCTARRGLLLSLHKNPAWRGAVAARRVAREALWQAWLFWACRGRGRCVSISSVSVSKCTSIYSNSICECMYTSYSHIQLLCAAYIIYIYTDYIHNIYIVLYIILYIILYVILYIISYIIKYNNNIYMIYKQREGEKTCKDICIYQSVYRRCTFLTYGFLQKCVQCRCWDPCATSEKAWRYGSPGMWKSFK